MKKIIALIIIASLALAIPPVQALADAELSAHSAIVLCADTGDVLFEKNADERMLIASITKIMTAIVVIENMQPDDKIVIKPEWSAIEGSSMYAVPGESYTVRELLYGMMLNSGNDAAAALACSVSGDETAFATKKPPRSALRIHPSAIRTGWTRTGTFPLPATWRALRHTAWKMKRSKALFRLTAP